MIRFVKNILDVTNLKGMQRSTPINNITFVSAIQDPTIILSGYGDITIESTSSGAQVVNTYTDPLSQTINVQSDLGTQVRIIGDSSQLTFTDSNGCNISEVVLNCNTLTALRVTGQSIERLVANKELNFLLIRNNTQLQYLDISKVEILSGIVQINNTALIEIKTRAISNTTANDVAYMITNASGIGDVYVPNTDDYFSIIETAAIGKGWTIHNL